MMFHPVRPSPTGNGPKYQKPRCGKQRLSSEGIGGFYVSAYRRILVGQSFSALSASSLQYVSAVSGSHSLSEAVLFLSLTFFGLISSKHIATSLNRFILLFFNFGYDNGEPSPPHTVFFFGKLSQSTVLLLHNDKVYYICNRPDLSIVF